MNRSLTVSWQDPHTLADTARSMAGIDFLRAIGRTIHVGSRIGKGARVLPGNGQRSVHVSTRAIVRPVVFFKARFR